MSRRKKSYENKDRAHNMPSDKQRENVKAQSHNKNNEYAKNLQQKSWSDARRKSKM